MRKNSFFRLLCLCAGIFFLILMIGDCDRVYAASDYQAILIDEAELLSDQQESDLKALLNEVAQYGNVALITVAENPKYNTQRYAEWYNENLFGKNSDAVLFMIDMDERYLYIDSMGKMRKTITSAYANTITDNVYRYASKSDYYTCTYKTFDQIYTLLRGRHIAQPMKYVSNALLALVIAMLINFFLAAHLSKKHKPSTREVLDGIYHKADVLNPVAVFTHQTKHYNPSSSSGGGHHGGGGGHGGGGHSGGGHSGGGHHF